ncbi:MAG: tRNA uridine(34) 5-carboxymethylaminomethyl modification radical SAM/GNAT enzyme Elp3 [Nanoarchaeota archaeon]|nr:tRNA uridine(34) 5-carboxymethylaminomethyl modification radical SAM/GNAT enzyme Elp3 [Nanoarchaeota archaeon]MBU1704652.1 tRNA uridine(34) 5-carboxymethylaminomethyl modification radical SAM/GNAT enzyme Elp3 [Nanoarchaeota archaeon]
MDFYQEIVSEIKKKKPSKAVLNKLKNKLCNKYNLKRIPTDIEILLHADDKDVDKVKRFLQAKPTRTISGVAVVAVMTKPMKCPHGKCITCPGGVDSPFGSVPQSYTGKEPATRRAIRNNYDPYLQVMNRLEQYVVSGHVPDKVELILMGGTFPSFPKRYQEDFVKYSFKAMNDFSKMFFKKGKFDFVKFKRFFELPGDINSKEREVSLLKKYQRLRQTKLSLETIQNQNEKSNIKCIGLTIETRPDYGKLKHGNEMLRLGATRVELGIQTIYDDVLERIERGHTVEDSIKSIKALKDLGFKLNFHMMLGLPGVTPKMDLNALASLFLFEDFQPDMLKLYPCMVLKGTKLYDIWKKKKFKPLTTKAAADIIAEFKEFVPEYCRIMRVQRDIPTFMTEAGVDKTNLRQYVDKVMKEKGYECHCIRCREIGQQMKGKRKLDLKKVSIETINYSASGGNEFFIQATAGEALLGFCRLRIPYEFLRKEITEDSALLRELHVYGPAVAIGKKGEVQHKGLGKKLLLKAEDIAKTYYKKKMVVISGIGARDYYRKLGYRREGPYMVKQLSR